MPAQARAVIIAALQAAAGAALPLVTTQSWYLTAATFVVVFALSVLANWFHLNLTPQQEQGVIAALAPALAQLGPALVALVEHLGKPQPPAVLAPPAPVKVEVVTPPAPAPAEPPQAQP